MDDVKIKVIDSDKLINAINEGSYDVNLSTVMALGAVMLDTKKQDCKDAVRGYPIDADALMEKVAEEYGERARDALYRIIRYMPPAQPERKTGKWITQEFGSWAECSECHELYDIPIAQSNFCPNCGADMRGEVNG